MSRFENMIVVVDGSEGPEQMAKTLLSLPLFANTKVTLLHAVPSQISADKMRDEWEKGQKLLASRLEAFPATPGISVATQLVEGDPKVVVCEMAESMPDSLIVIGSKDRNRLAAILENSVSQYTFQVSSSPMVLVKNGIYVRRPNRIMVALNGSPAALEAFQVALGLIRGIPGGQVFFAQVQLNPNTLDQDPALAEATATLKRENIPYQVFTAVGDPGVEITRLVAESNADLLVMGSPERRPSVARSLPDLDRLLGKSTSDYVRVHIECPVLMIRIPE